jgi:hypothetical protein
MPFRVAHRIATNRSVAGVHFPVDSAAGALIGCALGETMFRIASGRGRIDWPQPRTLDFGTPVEGEPPFDLSLGWLRDQLDDDAPMRPTTRDVFGTLWENAADEWEEAH